MFLMSFWRAAFPLRIVEYSSIPRFWRCRKAPGAGMACVPPMSFWRQVKSQSMMTVLVLPWGVNGGKPGARSNKLLKRQRRKSRVAASQMRPHQGCRRRHSLLQYVGWRRLGRSIGTICGLGSAGLPTQSVTVKGARGYGVVVRGLHC